jgi:hypothetical protein
LTRLPGVQRHVRAAGLALSTNAECCDAPDIDLVCAKRAGIEVVLEISMSEVS